MIINFIALQYMNQEFFYIETKVVSDYLNIQPTLYQHYIDNIVQCESYFQFKNLKTIPNDPKGTWDNLKIRLFIFFAAANQTFGKFVSVLSQQTLEELLKRNVIFFEGVIEFQTCLLLNQYLKSRLHQTPSKDEIKALFQLIIWKSSQLHFIIRIFIAYLVIVKIGKNSKIQRVFSQIKAIIEHALKGNSLYDQTVFLTDCKDFVSFWLKYIKGTNLVEYISDAKSLIYALQAHFKQPTLMVPFLKQLDELMIRSSKISIQKTVQDIDQSSLATHRKVLVKTQSNNFMPHPESLDKRIKSEQSFTFTKRILSSKRINMAANPAQQKQMPSSQSRQSQSQCQQTAQQTQTQTQKPQIPPIQQDPIFQLQLENYHIGQMVRKGYFKIKQQQPQSSSTQTQRIFKSQPSVETREPQVRTQQSIVQQDTMPELPLIQVLDPVQQVEMKISVKSPSSPSSNPTPKAEIKNNQQYNPYKLKNLISSRFQQILDLVQESQSSSPRVKSSEFRGSPLLRRQNTVQMQKDQRKREEFNQKEFEAFIGQHHQKPSQPDIDPPKSSRRSGLRISTPEVADQIAKEFTSNTESFKQSFKEDDLNIYFGQFGKQRLQRKNVVALQISNSFCIDNQNVYVPKFGFFSLYFQRGLAWRVKLTLNRKKQIFLKVDDQSMNKIHYQVEIVGVPYDQITNWQQVVQCFLRQFSNLIGSQLSYLGYNNQLTLQSFSSSAFLLGEYDYEVKEEQIKHMGLLKDVFRLLYTFYLYERRTVTGITLHLCQEKDLTLIALREFINVLYIYKQEIRKSLLRDDNKSFRLLQKIAGETLQKNIGLLNKLFNLRIRVQPNGKFLIHKQMARLQDLSINGEENDYKYVMIKASIVLEKENVIYYSKRDYFARQLIDIEFELDTFSQVLQTEYKPLKIRFDALDKILETPSYFTSKRLIDLILFQQRQFIPNIYQFIREKLMINEQKQLAIRLNIFSLQDAQKLEACGMKLGFLKDLKTKIKPFAITEIERYIQDDSQKKLKLEQTSQTIIQREHLFDKHFYEIFAEEYSAQDIQQKNKSSLIELVRRYQLQHDENKEEPMKKKVGQIQIYSENPFTDQHCDDYAPVLSQFRAKEHIEDNRVYTFRKQQNSFSVKINDKEIDVRYHQWKHFQKFTLRKYEDDENLIATAKNLVRYAPQEIVSNCLYKRLSQKVLKTSFKNTILYDGFQMMKQIQSKSMLAEIPTYNVLHYILLNNCNYLLRFFHLKQFVLIHKIKHYGKYQIIIRVFYRVQKPDFLTDNDYLLMRLDFQDISKKIGMMKLIFNRFDIVETLKLHIFTSITDSAIVDLAMSIFERVHLGPFSYQNVPYFADSDFNPSERSIKIEDVDSSNRARVQKIRRITNYPENSNFKKADFCKGFLDHFIKNSRLVLTHVKRTYLILHANYGQILRIQSQRPKLLSPDQVCSLEFVVIQVFRSLLLEQWIIRVYVPKTSRQVATTIKQEEFKMMDQEIQVHLFKKAIENMQISCGSYKEFDGHKFQKPIKRSSSQMVSPLPYFFELTKQVTEAVEFHQPDRNTLKFSFLEKKIWMYLITNCMDLDPYNKKTGANMTLLFQEQEFAMPEMLFERYIRIERVGESHIQFYIIFMQKPMEGLKGFALLKGKLNQLQGNRFSGLLYELKNNEDQVRLLKRTSIFFPFDAIGYANTSSYNIQLQYYSYNKFTEVREQINLRELLNLFIADGFFKYQTNYMNSKLNLSDIYSICYYIIFKIKNQNFLNLSQHHSLPNLSQTKHRKYSSRVILSNYKVYQKPFMLILNYIVDEIQIICTDTRTNERFNQIFSVDSIDLFGFKYVLRVSPKAALQRLSKSAISLLNINYNNP